jgi:hypothetical protein
MQNIKILSTVHKMIYDVLTMMTNDEHKDEPFEVGVKCRNQEIQLKIFKMLNCIFEEHEDLSIQMKEEDNVVCIIKNKTEIKV